MMKASLCALLVALVPTIAAAKTFRWETCRLQALRQQLRRP